MWHTNTVNTSHVTRWLRVLQDGLLKDEDASKLQAAVRVSILGTPESRAKAVLRILMSADEGVLWPQFFDLKFKTIDYVDIYWQKLLASAAMTYQSDIVAFVAYFCICSDILPFHVASILRRVHFWCMDPQVFKSFCSVLSPVLHFRFADPKKSPAEKHTSP